MRILAFFDSRYQADGTAWQRLRALSPQSREHYPRNLPGSLGEYDLTSKQDASAVMAKARAAGIDGFVIDCERRDGHYRHDAALLAPHCDAGFGLAVRWLNDRENVWTDASSVLEMERRAAALVESLIGLPAILVDGRIPIIIEHPKQFAAPAAVAALLRRAAEQSGLAPLYLIANRAEDKGRFLSAGFDALIDPSPDQWQSCKPNNHARGLDFLEVMAGLKDSSDYLDHYFSYLNFIVARMLNRPARGKVLARVFPAFSDWPLHPDGGVTQLVNGGHRPADATLFAMFIENAMLFTHRHFPPEEQVVFLQSWNGWMEGSQIEPSLLDGDLLFNAARAAIDRGRYMIASREPMPPSITAALQERIDRLCRATQELVTQK